MGSIFQPVLTEPDISAAAQIAPASAPDTTLANVIETVGGLGVEAYKGAKRSEFRETISESEEAFLGKTSFKDVMSSRQEEQDIIEGTFGDLTEADEAAIDDLHSKITKNKRAFREKIYSPGAFRGRVEADLKAAIAATPGLANDFRKIYNESLGQYSITSTEAHRKALMKSEADQRQEWMDYMADVAKDSFNLEYARTGQITPRVLSQNLEYLEAEGDTQKLKQMEALDTETSNILWRRNGSRFMSSSITSTMGKFKKHAANPDSVQGQEFITSAAVEAKNDLLSASKGHSSPELTSTLAYIDELKNFYVSVSSGKLTREEIETQNTTMALMAESEVYKIPGFLEHKAFFGSLGQAGAALMTSQEGRELMVGTMQMFNQMVKGDVSPFFNANKNEKQKFVQLTSGTATNLMENKETTEQDKQLWTQTMGKLASTWSADSTAADHMSLAAIMANPDAGELLSKYGTSEEKAAIGQVIEAHVNSLSENLLSTLTSGVHTFHYQPSGTVTISSSKDATPMQKDAAVLAMRTYGQTMTEYLKAQAHVQETQNYGSAASGFAGMLNAFLMMKDQPVTDASLLVPPPLDVFKEVTDLLDGGGLSISDVTTNPLEVIQRIFSPKPIVEEEKEEKKDIQIPEAQYKKIDPGVYQDEQGSLVRITEDGKVEKVE